MIKITREKIINDEVVEYIDNYYCYEDVIADDYKRMLKQNKLSQDTIENELIMLPEYLREILDEHDDYDSIEDIQNVSDYEEFLELFLEFVHYNVDLYS